MGNGTSGLYRLTRGGIVINGESIRIETRDRFRSEIIVASRPLLRHIDYDIDYDAGTLLFRQPINSRDFDFNPIFIVAEYETVGTADKQLNAGGRLGAQLLGGRLSAGVTLVRDESISGKSNLGGVDAEVQLTPDTELRIEAATTEGKDAAPNLDGGAYLAEIDHRSGSIDVLAYVRRQAPGFGLNIQNAVESGMFKVGIDAQARRSEHLAVRGLAYHQDNLVTDVTRDIAANAEIEYQTGPWRARAGALVARDEADTGETAESRQVTLEVSRSFFDQKLEVSARSDVSLGGQNDSVDYPSRYQLSSEYAITDDVRLVSTYEIADGEAFNSAMSRVGLEVVPWEGARLTSTLSQTDISEYGPRSFAVLGLTQSFLVGKRWGFGVSADSSRTFDRSGEPPLVINVLQPIASGGVLGHGGLTDDFFALTGGATYRSELWSWTGRAETRNGHTSDTFGFTTGFLRQAQAGLAVSATAQAFLVDEAAGPRGLLANASLSCRPGTGVLYGMGTSPATIHTYNLITGAATGVTLTLPGSNAPSNGSGDTAFHPTLPGNPLYFVGEATAGSASTVRLWTINLATNAFVNVGAVTGLPDLANGIEFDGVGNVRLSLSNQTRLYAAPIGGGAATAIGANGAMPAVFDLAGADVVPAPDLSITKSDGRSVMSAGGTLTYTVVVTNNAMTPITGTVTDTVPATVTGVNWTCTASAGSTCGAASGSGNAINTTATLAGGGTATYTVTGTLSAAATGTLTNTATVALPFAFLVDPTPANNTATDTTTINRNPGIAKAFAPATVPVNGIATLTFTLSNPNATALSGMSFTDTYPAGLVNATPLTVGGSCTGVTFAATAGGATFNVTGGAIPGGAPGTCTITVQVRSSAPGTYDNTASGVLTAQTTTAGAASNTDLFVSNLGGAGSGPVAFTALGSGLTYAFASLASTTDDVSFSNDGGTSYLYTPVPSAAGVDPAVTHIRINPKGTFGAASSFQLQFRVRVE